MENQDKNIDKHFRKLAEEQQPKSFQNMDKVWDNIEQKLDQKDKKKAFPFWKYAGIAAAVLVFAGLGIRFIDNSGEVLSKNDYQIEAIEILEMELPIEEPEPIMVQEEMFSTLDA